MEKEIIMKSLMIYKAFIENEIKRFTDYGLEIIYGEQISMLEDEYKKVDTLLDNISDGSIEIVEE